MPELNSLMDDLPAGLATDGDGTAVDDDTAADDTEEEQVDDTEQDDSEKTDEGEGDDEGAEDEGTDDKADDDEEDDDDFVVNADDEENKPADTQNAPKPPAAAMTDEGQYILSNLPKIKVNVVLPSADGKSREVKEVEVYGWGDLPRNMLGFQSAYEQGVFTASAQNNELKARELQQNFRQEKIKADTEAYTLRENRAIARDLRDLRQQGVFPKFKGMPGTPEFNSSEGAKEFDRVVAFMNEENDKAGQAAQKGDAFYHISFKQAYRMLHPELFDEKRKVAQRENDKKIARRVKTGGGTRPTRNTQVQRVSNITDLESEFANFTGSNR